MYAACYYCNSCGGSAAVSQKPTPSLAVATWDFPFEIGAEEEHGEYCNVGFAKSAGKDFLVGAVVPFE